MASPFIGRATELAAILALPALARRSGRAAAAMVIGQPGSGKSRLLGRVATALDGPAGRLVGYEPFQSVPLAAAADLLRELGTADLADASRDSLRIFEAAHLGRVERGVTTILIDDVQWLDGLSVGLIQYLVRAAESARKPLVVVAAGRPSPAATTFEDGIVAVIAEDRRAIIELGPLGHEDGVALAISLDPALNAGQARLVWDRAQGSPFWIEALVRGGGGEGLPELIRGRLAGLDRDAAHLVGALAVGARPLGEGEVAGVLAWPVRRVRHAVDELILRGLATRTGPAVRFAHDLIREEALVELPAGARRDFHARFARSIEELPSPDLALLREALEHREAAGLPRAQIAMRLLASPKRRLLGEEGLRVMMAIADGLGDDASERGTLGVGVAELATELGEQELAIERWARVADRAASASVGTIAELAAAMAAFRLGRAEVARRHLARARRAAEAAASSDDEAGYDPALAIEMDALDATIAMWLEHRTDDGARAAGRAVDAARLLASAAGGVDRLHGRALGAYLAALEAGCDAATQESRPDDLRGFSREIERLADHLGDDALYVEAITRAGSGLRELGGAADAERLLRRAWAVARERILPSLADEVGHWLSRELVDRGHLAEAHAVATETLELEGRLGHGSRHWGRIDAFVHRLELSIGDPKAALAALRRGADLETDRHHELGVRQTIAEWQARSIGPPAAADIDAQLAIARAAAAEVACPRCGHELAIVDAEIQARLGRPAEARAGRDTWLAAEAARGGKNRLWRLRADSAIAFAGGDYPAAAEAARAVIDESITTIRADRELWARIDLGLALEPIDRAAAIDALGEAAGLADRIGAVSEGRQIAAALRRLGVRAWRRSPAERGTGSLAVLSRREREIAVRIAAGATNAEVAEALLISPKTVERHVTNVFAKLALRNRAELATVVRGSPDDPEADRS
jgi:DNA-binding CsgD family transcriptional regulator